MSRELRDLKVAFTVDRPEHLPLKNGEPMYADDVVEEISDVIEAALGIWYQGRGRDLLSGEPIVA
ncbi:MAG: hypothetical protein ACJ768_11880 [Gaiellaceae bacterium]